MAIEPLSLIEAEYVAHALAYELMNSDSEPIPPFDTRSPGKLESCLAEPFQSFDGKSLHRTFNKKAAVLFYLITKNHCFGNGNKRMAVTLTLSFFHKNGRWLDIPPLFLYRMACDVAESEPKNREAIQGAVNDMFNKYKTSFPSTTDDL